MLCRRLKAEFLISSDMLLLRRRLLLRHSAFLLPESFQKYHINFRLSFLDRRFNFFDGSDDVRMTVHSVPNVFDGFDSRRFAEQ